MAVHSVLDESDWDLDELKDVLELDPSSINFPNEEGKSPLIRVLEHENCSVDAVTLLLHYGADANFRAGESSPLSAALVNCRDEPIIRLLLTAGANPNRQHCNRSLLCIAMAFTTFDVVKLFLNPDCAVNACGWHGSVVHCVMSYTNSKSSLEVLSLLLKTNKSLVNRLDRAGNPIMCFVLSNGARAEHIELLLSAGASFNACTKHASLFHCATSCSFKPLFRASVVTVLLKAGACSNTVDDNGQTPLQLALKNCDYEPKAIELLLHLLGEDAKTKVNDDNLLHYALSNHTCKLSVLKQLLGLKAAIEKVDNDGNTPLHLAVQFCPPRIISYLLEMGSPPNLKNNSSETPLMVAVMCDRDPDILKMLYVASSRIANPVIGTHTYTLIQTAVFNDDRDRCDKTRACIKTLMKFSFLENPDFDTVEWIQDEVGYKLDYKLKGYAKEYKNELQKLEQNHGADLLSYLRGYSLSLNGQPEAAKYDLNQLLKIRPDKEFPIFFDIFVYRVSRPVMKMKLQEIIIYAPKKCSDSSSIEKKVILHDGAISEIIQYLSDADVLRLILAYFKPLKQAESSNVRAIN